MLTPDQIAQVTVFAELERGDCERLANAAADIALLAGEYAAFEGGERALFAVIEGHIEAVKQQDGIERVVGASRAG